MEDWLIFQIRPLVEYRQNQRTQNKLIEWSGETRAWLQNQREQKKYISNGQTCYKMHICSSN